MKCIEKFKNTKVYKFVLLHKNVFIIIFSLIFISLGIILKNVNFDKKVYAKDEYVAKSNSFKVTVEGAVKKPMVIYLDDSIYLYEAVNMCGGFTDTAKLENINLIKRITNDEYIFIESDNILKNNEIEIVDISKSINAVLLYLEKESRTIYKVDKGKRLYEVLFQIGIETYGFEDIIIDKDYSLFKESSLININTASVSELKCLDKIGEATAEKIVEYRNSVGLFKKIEDIMNVKGIGESIFYLIKDKICVG